MKSNQANDKTSLPRNDSSRGLKYMPQLDGLRAIAVLMVMAEHWTSYSHRLYIHWGAYGVQLFFVLSGYLITGILLNCRDTKHSRLQELRIFYIRRFLRIFPIFYLTLGVTFIIGFSAVRETFWWHFFYLSNLFLGLRTDVWGYVNHLWSLSVEEQFYLIWPWLMLFVSPQRLKRAIVLAFMLAPLCKIILWLFESPVVCFHVLPIASFDGLGFGSLLAYLKYRSRISGAPMPHRSLNSAALLGLASCIALERIARKGTVAPLNIFGNTMLALPLGWIVFRSAEGFPKPFAHLLDNKIAIYLGKISYGLYLMHPFVSYGFKLIELEVNVPQVHIPQLSQPHFRIPILFSATVLLASLSWFFLEKPINRLKRCFPYR